MAELEEYWWYPKNLDNMQLRNFFLVPNLKMPTDSLWICIKSYII